MITLTTNWAEAWAVTGYGVGTVFVILCLLVLVLVVFDKIASVAEAKAPKKADPLKAAKRQTGDAPTLAEVTDHDKVAIATALYMYFNDMHDNESGVLTIHHNDNSGWHFQLGN